MSAEGTPQTWPQASKTLLRNLKWSFPESVGSLTLIGRSWACDKTSFHIPELAINLDAGFKAHVQLCKYILVTHAHGDHSMALHTLVSRRRPPEIYVPSECKAKTLEWMYAYEQFKLNLNDRKGLLESFRMYGASAGQIIDAPGSKDGMQIRIFNCKHSTPCVGYGIGYLRKKLKKDFEGLSGKEIGQLRKDGMNVTEEVYFPKLVFMGDTTAEALYEQEELLKQYPVIIVECSFLTDEFEERAKKTKHVFYPALRPFIAAHPDTTFVLIHFSKRYSEQEVADFFLKESLKNIVPWVCPSANENAGSNGEEEEEEDDYGE